MDKLLHFIFAYALVIYGKCECVSAGIEADRALAIASLATFVLIIAKEIADEKIKKTTFDKVDVIFGLAGMFLAIIYEIIKMQII